MCKRVIVSGQCVFVSKRESSAADRFEELHSLHFETEGMPGKQAFQIRSRGKSDSVYWCTYLIICHKIGLCKCGHILSHTVVY